MAGVRIALERLLHQQRQAVEAFAHVDVAARQPHPRLARQCDRHRRRPPPASAAIFVVSLAGSTAPVIRIRDPFANSTSIRPGKPVGVGSAAIRTAAKPAGGDRRSSCRRHPYSWLGWIPASRATAETLDSSEAATIRSFSAALQRRRRSTDVMTSIALLT
jgi:hypothetical protein